MAVHDRLHVVTAGDGTPVVLLHGLTATHRYVVMGSTHLQRAGHRVVAYDARGHGASKPAPDAVSYTYAELLADLLAVLDAQGIDRAVLAGASMGAHTALKAALEHPDRVAGLVLVTPAYDPVRHDDAVAVERWDALSDGLRTGGVDGFVAAYDLDALPAAWRATIEQVLRQRLERHEHPDAVADALRAVPRSRPFAAYHELESMTGIPTVVVGDRDEADPEHPLAVAQAYASLIPGAELVLEDEGRSPIAWQGGQLSRVIEGVAARAAEG